MKKYLLLFALACQMLTANATTKISRVEPTDWYVGMKDPTLQLMVYGKDVRNADVKIDYPGVKIDSLVRLDSPNYLLIYLNLDGAKAGNMKIKIGGKTLNYQLKQRAMSGDKHMGFTNADVLYLMMPDRFANGNPRNDAFSFMRDKLVERSEPSMRHGGDLEGIRQHLDYFTQLGVTALWFTPVLENDRPADQGKYSSYHGYATTNYYRVDPRFGTNEEYRQLVNECHQRGLKVVMDMIFNHCADTHPWITDIPSKDWFNSSEWLSEGKGTGRNPATGYISDDNAAKSKYLQTSYKLTPVLDPYASKIDMKETVDGWFVPSMPDLNQRNHHVIKYLIQNSMWWIETVGIDGIRMDTYPYADRKAMARWMKVLNDEYPNFNTVGETWVAEPAYTAAWQKDSKLSNVNSNLKTVMDFSFYEKINTAKNEETDGGSTGFNRIYNSFVYDYLYADPSHVMAFIENHDTNRFLESTKDATGMKQALALLLTVNRIPQLYYGSEVLMNGTKEITDGNVRKDFPGGFSGDTHNCFSREGRTDAENAMFDWLSRLLHWRQDNEVIIKGKQIQFMPFKGVYVVGRQYNGKSVMTIVNGNKTNAELDVKRYAEIIASHTQATDITTGKQLDLTHNIPLAARQTVILEF